MLIRHIRRVLQTILQLSHLKLAAIDRLDALGFHYSFESHASADGSVICTGAGRHALFFAKICRSPRFHKSMVEGVVRIEMQMDEG